jgi:hypothetical protein
MYTQFQRFVATILLFSILLQSCGNPNLKIADDEAPRGGSGAKTYHPAKVKQRSESSALATAESFTDGSMEPKAGGTPTLSDASSGQRSTEALAAVSSKASDALAGETSHVLQDDCSNTPSPSPVFSVIS